MGDDDERPRALLRPERAGNLALDPVAYEVWRGERRIDLSRTEFHLLAMFMEHPRQVLIRSRGFESRAGVSLGQTG